MEIYWTLISYQMKQLNDERRMCQEFAIIKYVSCRIYFPSTKNWSAQRYFSNRPHFNQLFEMFLRLVLFWRFVFPICDLFKNSKWTFVVSVNLVIRILKLIFSWKNDHFHSNLSHRLHFYCSRYDLQTFSFKVSWYLQKYTLR